MDRLSNLAFALQNADALTVLLVLLAKVTLIAVIGRLVIAALPRVSSATRYLIAVTTFLAMLAVPILSATGLQWHLNVLPPDPASPPRASSAVIDVVATAEPAAGASTAAAAFQPEAVQPPPVTFRETWRGWIVLATFLIGAALIGRMAFGMLAIAWITSLASEIENDAVMRDFDVACEQLGVTRNVRLLVSDHVSVPMMWGVTRPALLLPAAALTWTRDRLRVVFLHELAHLRRGDVITLLVTRATAALYWFHPLAWSLDRAARRECEQACDDLVLTAGTRASDYADHLLEIARTLPGRDPFGSVTLAMSRRSQLEGRLLSILQANTRRGTASRGATAMAFILAGLIALPVSTVRLTAMPLDNEESGSIVSAFTGTMSKAVVAAVARTVSAMAYQEREAATIVAEASPLPEKQSKWKEEEKVKEAQWKEEKKTRDGEIDHFARAKEAFAEKDWERSISEYKQAIEAGQKPSTAMYNIACAYARAGASDAAIEWLDKAIRNGFNNAGLIAEDSDLDSIRSHPRFASIARSAGTKYESKSRAAVDRYESLRASGNASSRDLCDVGVKLLRMRDLPRATNALTEGVRLGAENGTCWYNLACAYALGGSNERALDTLEIAIQRGSGVDREHILEDSDLASVRGPRLTQLAQLADDLVLRTGDQWNDEVTRYAAIAKKYPNVPRAQFNYGFVLISSGKANEAIDVFTRLLGTGYKNSTVMYNLACAYAVAGDRQNALSWLMKAERAGFHVGEKVKHDDDLRSLRDDPWVKQQIEQAWIDSGAKKSKKHEE